MLYRLLPALGRAVLFASRHKMKGVNMSKQKQRKPTKEPKTTEVATELTDEELSKVSGGTFKAFGDIKGETTDKDHKDWVMI